MTREEKAKAYDEALDRMKHVVIVPENEKALQALKETIFPELRESEDERIRKIIRLALIASEDELSDFYKVHNTSRKECTDWLEKQKEQKPEQYDIDVLEKHITKDSISELAHTVIVRNGWEIVEKEQKPVMCIEFDNEFENQVSHLLASVLNGEWEYNEGFVKHAAQSLLGYAKNEQKSAEIDECEIIKKHITDDVLSSEVECEWHVTDEKPAGATINGEPIPAENKSVDIPLAEWSEEDEKRIQRIHDFMWKNRKGDTDTIYQIEKDADWLKALPERFNLQPKQELDEKGKKVIDEICNVIVANSKDGYLGRYSACELVGKLKSLRPQSHCKPTEKQKYDGNMDKECIKLCDVLNSIPSIDTFESCCGHLKDRYSIWFFCNDIITISRLGKCVERNYSDGKWELLVDSTDTHPTGVFWLRSKVPFQSYDEMEESVNWLCNCIQYWFNTKFDSYFNNDLQKLLYPMKYIEAEPLRVEIEKHIKEVKDVAERFKPNLGFFDAKLSGIYDVMAIIDSIQQEQSDKESLNESQQEFVNVVTERMLKEGPIPTLKGKQKAEFEKEFNRFKQIAGMVNWPAYEEIYKKIILWFMAWGADNLPNLNKVTGPDELDSQQEQPEVDFEKELKNERAKLLDAFGPMNGEQSLAIKNFARHFIELGLNARKED